MKGTEEKVLIKTKFLNVLLIIIIIFLVKSSFTLFNH